MDDLKIELTSLSRWLCNLTINRRLSEPNVAIAEAQAEQVLRAQAMFESLAACPDTLHHMSKLAARLACTSHLDEQRVYLTQLQRALVPFMKPMHLWMYLMDQAKENIRMSRSCDYRLDHRPDFGTLMADVNNIADKIILYRITPCIDFMRMYFPRFEKTATMSRDVLHIMLNALDFEGVKGLDFSMFNDWIVACVHYKLIKYLKEEMDLVFPTSYLASLLTLFHKDGVTQNTRQHVLLNSVWRLYPMDVYSEVDSPATAHCVGKYKYAYSNTVLRALERQDRDAVDVPVGFFNRSGLSIA